jgi:acetyltransferase
MSTLRLAKILDARSVAVVGASPKGGFGTRALQNIMAGGFGGELVAIHRSVDTVEGFPAYPSLAAVPFTPDLVIAAVPAAVVADVLVEAAEVSAGGAIVFGSGFGEMGEEGKALQARLRTAGLPVLGPNCLGGVNYSTGLAAWGIGLPLSHVGAGGTVAIASHSGNMLLTQLNSSRIPRVKYAVSLGNEADIDAADAVEYFAADPAISVMLLILEHIRSPERFRAMATAATAAGKRVVVLKLGRSVKGREAAAAHTGSIVGSDRAYQALFRQSGVVLAEDPDQATALVNLFASGVQPINGMGIFASSGGDCGLTADAADAYGVTLTELAPQTVAELSQNLSAFSIVANPLDMSTGRWGNEEYFTRTSKALASDPGVDAVAFVGDSPNNVPGASKAAWPAMVRGLATGAAGSGKRGIIITTTTDVQPELSSICREHGVVLLNGIRNAFGVLAKAQSPTTDPSPALRRAADAPAQVGATHHGLGTVGEGDTKALMTKHGLRTPNPVEVADADAAVREAGSRSGPVVVKLSLEGVTHKSDVGGVRLNLRGPGEVHAAASEMLAGLEARGISTHGARFLIEDYLDVETGVEVLISATRTELGLQAVVGMGGVWTELLAEVGVLISPFDAADVKHIAGGLPRLGRMLAGYRGTAPKDVDALANAVLRLVAALEASPHIHEIEINPYLVLPQGQGGVVLDALATTEPEA